MIVSSGTASKTALVVLAAGSSTRMGAPKQLLEWRGKPLVRHVVEAGLGSYCHPVIVVVGSQAELVSAALRGLNVQIVENTDWEQGMGSSIRAGVSAAEAHGLDGLILTLADQPFISAPILNSLMDAAKPIVASEYSDTVGVPVYFGRHYFQDLLALKPSQGCKGLILAHPEAVRIPCPEAEFDIDTPEDYAAIKSAYPE